MVVAKEILVADDDPNVIRALTFVLGKAGFATATAGNGEEALARVKSARPALMFLDVMMPKLDGHQVCEAIKADPALKDTYVIMLTAKGQDADRERGLKAGADELMTKPFSPAAVVQRVKELLD